ncbi:unnamed protein product [Rotaria sordida]|uniref:phospholipase D n=1 Tax=Rotaria sordida TaxID=392033 RepID=A0A814VJW4_9BILA|nr:unnamed protein product [Rotaria sordida]
MNRLNSLRNDCISKIFVCLLMQNENQDYPRFPTKNDRMAFINDTIIQQRCAILIDYLNKVLKHPKFRKHSATCEFFEVSCLSFIYGVSISRKEGYLLKRSHDEYPGQRILFRLALFCDIFKRHHDRKWFVIKDSYVTYIRPNTHEVRFPMLVDRDFHILTGLRNVGAHHGIKIKNLQRTLVIKCRTSRDSDEWTQHLSNLIQQGKGFIDKTASRFVSFAPVRENQLAYWFVNGKSYMEAVARALLTAKEEVFITDWWLSPEIMLIRPTDDETFRLDNVLGRIADAGIRVYVMVFKEMSFAMGLNSAYTKRILTNKSKGGFIKVIRHPDHHPKGGVFLWSHHEKLVVIDQKIAFVGGIDLCYGRWDDDFMRLVDLGADNDTTLKSPFDIVAEKVAAGGTEIVESAQKATTQMAEQAGEKPIKRVRKNSNGSDIGDIPEESQSAIGQSSEIDRKQKFFIGKDYSNVYEKDFETLEKYSEDYIDRKLVPRMPWHDEALVVIGEIARDVARHFIQRWNIHKCEKYLNNDHYPFLLPKSYDDEEDLTVKNWREFLQYKPFKVDAQCVRSVGPWSAGTRTIESSIHNAYIQMITAAKYYIYIENQFFITIGYDPQVRNQVGDTLFRRIERAHKSNEKFRVYIVIPLLPGFDSINAVQAVLFFIMRSITKGDSSLFKRLEKAEKIDLGINNTGNYPQHLMK